MSFSIITGKSIHSAIHADIAGCVACVDQAYRAHQDKKTVNPDSYFLLFPDQPRNRIIALPAFLGGEEPVAGLKWIASWPANIQQGIPRASAVLILNDYQTGYPFACLESSIISAARTAGSAVLAAEWMNEGKRATRSLGIIGNGLIARYVYTFFMAMGWEIEQVLLYDASPDESVRFGSTVCQADRHRAITCVPDHDTLVKNSDIVLLATTAATPYLHEAEAFAHNPLVLNISLRDIAPEIMLRSYNIVDDVEHVMKANTSPHLAEKLSGGRSFVTGTLAQLMRGQCQIDRDRPRIFSPFGLGVLDLAVGKWVYELARKRDEHLDVADFFYEMTR